MRLYVNANEVADLKRAILHEACNTTNAETVGRLTSLYERIELCEKLQKNLKKANGGS